MTTTTLNTAVVATQAADTLAFKNAVTIQERIAEALTMLAEAVSVDFKSAIIKLKACTVLAQGALENGGSYRFNHDLNWNGFSDGELKTLKDHGLKAKHIVKKQFTHLTIEHTKDFDDKGKEFVAWQAWELEHGEAVRIAKPKADKKAEGTDTGTIKKRFLEHGDLTKAQIQVLISSLLELERLKGID